MSVQISSRPQPLLTEATLTRSERTAMVCAAVNWIVFNRVLRSGSDTQTEATLRHLVFQSMHRVADERSRHAPFLHTFAQMAAEQGTAVLRADQERRLRLQFAPDSLISAGGGRNGAN